MAEGQGKGGKKEGNGDGKIGNVKEEGGKTGKVGKKGDKSSKNDSKGYPKFANMSQRQKRDFEKSRMEAEDMGGFGSLFQWLQQSNNKREAEKKWLKTVKMRIQEEKKMERARKRKANQKAKADMKAKKLRDIMALPDSEFGELPLSALVWLKLTIEHCVTCWCGL